MNDAIIMLHPGISRRSTAVVAAWFLLLLMALGARVQADDAPLPEVAEGHWYEIPDSRLRDAALPRSPGGRLEKIMAWSGGALDPGRNLFYVWGGGHSDYAGNEVYRFSLTTLHWERLSDPSVPNEGRTSLYPDGQPRARHTYNYLEFAPNVDRLISFGGSGAYPVGGGEFTRQLSEMAHGDAKWTTGVHADVPKGGNLIGAQARFDRASGKVVFLASQRAAPMLYDPVASVWTTGWGPAYVRVHATAAVDPVRRKLVLIGSGKREAPQALAWPIDGPGPAQDLRPRTTGDVEIEWAYGPGFDYHGPSSRFVAWAGGGDVYVLDPDRWIWTRVPAAPGSASVPGPQFPTGTYGRFRYVPSLDLFVLVNGVDQNVFLYRLARTPPDRVAGD